VHPTSFLPTSFFCLHAIAKDIKPKIVGRGEDGVRGGWGRVGEACRVQTREGENKTED